MRVEVEKWLCMVSDGEEVVAEQDRYKTNH